MKRKKNLTGLLVYLMLTGAALFTLFPLLMALINSFKSKSELLSDIMAWPTAFNFENYRRAFEKMSYWRSFLNTALLAGLSVGLIILFSSLAGWKLCRNKTRLSRFVLKLFIFSMLIPFSSIMIPLYKVTVSLQIKNSLLGLSFVYAGLGVAMAIFLYHGFVKGIPAEMEDAARIDGCGELQTFFRIVFPLLRPITATICITNVLWIWNDFLLPLTVIADRERYTLLLSTNTLFGRYGNDWPAILSALMLAALPVVAFYALLQKRILKGIADGAVKG